MSLEGLYIDDYLFFLKDKMEIILEIKKLSPTCKALKNDENYYIQF